LRVAGHAAEAQSVGRLEQRDASLEARMSSSNTHPRRKWLAVAIVAIIFATATSGDSAEATKKKTSRVDARMQKVRADLHRNLDGKGGGFILGWRFNSKVFTLQIDRSRYEQNKLLAATMAARSIFDSNNVPLPRTLIIRDESGANIGEGPFSNVPSLTQ
jgi:hypothetical protein